MILFPGGCACFRGVHASWGCVHACFREEGVCASWGACMLLGVEGVCASWGHACFPGGMHAWGCMLPRGACMIPGGGCACFWGDWGGMRASRGCMPRGPACHAQPHQPDTTRFGRSISERCATYWNVFLLSFIFIHFFSTSEA